MSRSMADEEPWIIYTPKHVILIVGTSCRCFMVRPECMLALLTYRSIAVDLNKFRDSRLLKPKQFFPRPRGTRVEFRRVPMAS
jgi:hypothetical protein